MAAEMGDSVGQMGLAGAYYEGKGVPQDYVQAHAWFNVLASQGHGPGLKYRDIVATKMTPDQIADAQKLSRDIFDRIEKRKKLIR